MWIIIILVGIGRFQLNWNMQTIDFNIVSMGIPSFSFLRSFSGDWVRIVCYVPVGLLIYYIKLIMSNKKSVVNN